MSAVLRVSAFRRLLAAYVFNELAWSVGTVALSLLVYRRTGSAIGSTGFYLCSQFVPAILTPPLVARIDRRAPNRLLPALYGIEAVLFGLLALLTSDFLLVPVLVLALLDGVVALIARSMASATRARVLRPLDLLPEGNALSNTLFGICYMAGPLIGGVIVVAGGTVAALLVNCGFFAVMACLLATAQLPGDVEPGGPSTGRLRAAIDYVRGEVAVRRLLGYQTLAFACFTICVPVEVVYARDAVHAGAGGYGALLSAWGAGAVVGSLVIVRLRRGSPSLLMGFSALSLAIGFGLMTVAPTLTLALVGMGLGGVGNAIEVTAATIAIQQRVSERWMALTMSLNQSISAMAPGVGILIGGLITQLADSRAALATAAVGSLVLTVIAFVGLRPVAIGTDAPSAGAGDAQATAPVGEHVAAPGTGTTTPVS